MRIVVMGAGGMGGYFGGRLARAGETVAFVARGDHLQAIQTGGLHVRSVTGDFTVAAPATDDPRRIADLVGTPDLVLFCVKSYDTAQAAEALRPALGRDTAVLTVQNGVVNEDTLASIVGAERVLGGVVYGFAVIEAPGVIRHTQLGRMVLGEMEGPPTPRVERFREAGLRAGFPVEASAEMRRVLWLKYLIIGALSGLTAITRRPLGEVRSCAESNRLLRMVVEELAAVGVAEGVSLPADVVETTLRAIDTLRPDSYSSLYHDLAHGKRLELEALHGHAVRLGARHGIPTPACFAIYAALRPAALATEAGRG